MSTTVAAPAFDRFYIGDHYCALHPAAPKARRGVCVVISSPVGRDARWTYRSMVLFASALAARGFDVLRFDPAGEGDSGDVALNADQWALWTAGLTQVTTEARRLTGADKVVLLGLRFGGTLARFAAKQAKADGLVLLDPPATGAAWLQELNLLRAMFIEPAPPESAVESLGLRISHATKAALDKVDLATLPALNIPSLYASPFKDKEVAAALGPQVHIVPFKGYASFFREGYLSTFPEWTFSQVADWLESAFPKAAPSAAPAAPVKRQLSGRRFTEQSVVFGEGHPGVITRPTGANSGASILIGNTGADPRAGVGNFAAYASRALAARGVTTLRFDFDGFGESDPKFGFRTPVYDTPRLETYHAAADFLVGLGLREPALIGVCTGGFHALQALLDDTRFSMALAINSWLLPSGADEQRSLMDCLRSRFMDAQPDLAAKVDPLLQTARALAPCRRAKPAEPAATAPEPDAEANAALDRIAHALACGRDIHLIMGDRDASRGGLERFGEDGMQRLAAAGLTQHFEPIDHGLYARDSQEIVLKRIFDVLNLHPTAPSNDDRPMTKAFGRALSG